MTHPTRGGIYPYQGIRRRHHVLVLSIDNLNRLGTVVVVEVTTDAPPEDLRALLAVQLSTHDPLPGAWVLAWRLSYAQADRLDLPAAAGTAHPTTMERVTTAVRTLIDQ